jgi:hypothetical protein
MREVGKQFSTLKHEVVSLKQQFREARERARLDAEQKKLEAESAYAPPVQQATAGAAGAASAR